MDSISGASINTKVINEVFHCFVKWQTHHNEKYIIILNSENTRRLNFVKSPTGIFSKMRLAVQKDPAFNQSFPCDSRTLHSTDPFRVVQGPCIQPILSVWFKDPAFNHSFPCGSRTLHSTNPFRVVQGPHIQPILSVWFKDPAFNQYFPCDSWGFFWLTKIFGPAFRSVQIMHTII